MALLNPLGINGPNSQGNYQQPDYRNPAPNPAVASYPVGANVLNLSWPLPLYAQPGVAPASPY